MKIDLEDIIYKLFVGKLLTEEEGKALEQIIQKKRFK